MGGKLSTTPLTLTAVGCLGRGAELPIARLAVLDRASKGWRGLTMTPKILRQLQDLRRELLDEPPPLQHPEEPVNETVTAAA